MPAADVRTVLLTGNELRHRYAAAHLAAATRLLGVVIEEKMPPAVAVPASEADREVLGRHFAGRDAAEWRLLGRTVELPPIPRLSIPAGGVNSAGVFDWVSRLQPEAVVLYGTSIVRPPLLDAFAGRIVNLHLGLSPYYRGSATNFWPLVHGEPECVGATLHLAVQAVDAGGILQQVRPDPDAGDRAHELGTKALQAALDALPAVLERVAAGRAEPRSQDLSRGRVFRRAQFGPDAVRTMWSNFEGGMMDAYVADLAARRAAFPIVTASPERR